MHHRIPGLYESIRSIALAAMLIMLLAGWVGAVLSEDTATGNSSSGQSEQRAADRSRSKNDENSKIKREGSPIADRVARIALTGDRLVAHFEDDGTTFTLLENLSLQRIAEAIKLDSTENLWMVSGRLTEYQGYNYLLIERANRANRSAK